MSTIEYTMIELQDTPSYVFSCTCLGELLTFTITWCTRKAKRIINVKNSQGECILQNTYLNPSEPLAFNFNAVESGFDCSISLDRKDLPSPSLDLLNWSTGFFLSIFRVTEDE